MAKMLWPAAILSALGASLLLPAFAAECGRTSTGLIPLNDSFFGAYRGFTGGLYPNGANHRPPAHEAAGLRLAADVRPRRANGAVDDANGRVVLLSIGMSNTTQEFSVFKKLADADEDKNPRLVIVDGAQGGWSADRIVSGGDPYWATVDARLAAAGVTASQVQVGWMKQAVAGPTWQFPEDARRLHSYLRSLARTLRARFPNLRLLYFSSRIYAGYASTGLNPEPYAYQSAFSVKWLIEEQLNGDPELSFDAGQAPWLAWGPYLWADGAIGREDGLVWNCDDLQEDGTHPSESGRRKVALMLLDFFKSDTTALRWYVRPASQQPPAPSPTAVVSAADYSGKIAAGAIAAIFGSDLAAANFSAPGTPLPKALGGTVVRIGPEPVSLYYVSPGQINFVLPKSPAGEELVVVREGVESRPLRLTLGASAPAVFTLNGWPDGPAAARHAGGRVVSAGDPAAPGAAVELYLTGLGVRNPLLKQPEVQPVVLIGEAEAEVLYAGPAPGFPGLNQINFKVPPGAAAGDMPLSVQSGTSASNRVKLAVGPAGVR